MRQSARARSPQNVATHEMDTVGPSESSESATTVSEDAARALGLRAPTVGHVIKAIRAGFRVDAITRVQKRYALPPNAVATVAKIPKRTLDRRKSTGRLSPVESNRVYQLTELLERATRLFNNDPAAARRWMTSPQWGLGGAIPIDLIDTGPGVEAVKAALGRIEDGIFA